MSQAASPVQVRECMCGLWAQQGCVLKLSAGVYMLREYVGFTHSHRGGSVYQGVHEKEQKAHIASNREKKDAEFSTEKACTGQDLATESVCPY